MRQPQPEPKNSFSGMKAGENYPVEAIFSVKEERERGVKSLVD